MAKPAHAMLEPCLSLSPMRHEQPPPWSAFGANGLSPLPPAPFVVVELMLPAAPVVCVPVVLVEPPAPVAGPPVPIDAPPLPVPA
jgi:hypothetical protein